MASHKLYIIAGESSGDMHGANLLAALQAQLPGGTQVEARGMGGDRLAAAGMQLTAHNKAYDFMGFAEVIRNLGTIRGLFKRLKQDIRTWRPDAILLIDYPGFNLRMAKFCHQLGIKVIYYISPQLWAWKAGRVKQIQKYVDELLVIFPFEVGWYAQHDVQAHFVGHPLIDVVDDKLAEPDTLRQDMQLDERPILALLPGSRMQEIKRMLPVMALAAKKLEGYQPVIAGAPSREQADYAAILAKHGLPPLPVAFRRAHDLMRTADMGIVCSGTATMEAALFKLPMLIGYRTSWLTYRMAKRVVGRHLRFIGMPNIVMDRPIVPELIQHNFGVKLLYPLLQKLARPAERERLQNDYTELRSRLGGAGASHTAAQHVLRTLNPTADQPPAP